MLPGGLVRDFGELANQFFEDEPHLRVVDNRWMQVYVRKLLGHEVQQVRLGEPFNLRVEVKALEDIARGRRERLDVGVQVLPDMVLVAEEFDEVEQGGVVKRLSGLSGEKRVGIQPRLGLCLKLGQYRRLRRLQYAIETAQNRKRQDDAAVLGLLIVAAQEVGDGPDK
jgi:hypothetical protein